MLVYADTVTFGHFTDLRDGSPNKKHIAAKIFHNIINTVDYIPGVSMISGIARLTFLAIMAISPPKLETPATPQEIQEGSRLVKLEAMRGCVSLAGLGFLFFVPDMLMNAVKAKKIDYDCEQYGFFSSKSVPDMAKPMRVIWNCMNGMDYIPGVSIISGIARLTLLSVIAAKAGGVYKDIALQHTARGTAAILGLGFLYAMPDLIFTLNRSRYPRST